eukprot:tig00021312_g20090.t1
MSPSARWACIWLAITLLALLGRGAAAPDGSGAPIATLPTGSDPKALALCPSQDFLLVGAQYSGIYKVDLKTGATSLVVGSPSGTIGYVDGVGTTARLALGTDSGGQVVLTRDCAKAYIGDQENNYVRKLDLATGTLSTLAGNGNASNYQDGFGTLAAASGAIAMALSPAEDVLYFTSRYVIRSLDLNTLEVKTLLGPTDRSRGSLDGVGSAARLDSVDGGLALIDNDTLVYAQWWTHHLRVVKLGARSIRTVTGPLGTAKTGRDGVGTAATVYYPIVHSQGYYAPTDTLYFTEMYVADSRSAPVRRLRVSRARLSPAELGSARIIDTVQARLAHNSFYDRLESYGTLVLDANRSRAYVPLEENAGKVWGIHLNLMCTDACAVLEGSSLELSGGASISFA